MKFGCKPSQELQCNCSSMIYSKVSERFFPTSFQSLKGPFGLFGGALKCGGTRRPRPDPDPSKDGMTGRGRNSNIFNCLNLAPFRGQKDRQTSGWVKGLKWKWSKETVISEGYILLGSSSDDSKDDERDLSEFALT